MIQYLIVFIVGYFVGVDFGNSPLALLLIAVAFVLCITALTFAIAPHISSEGQANGMARLLGLSLAPLGGAWAMRDRATFHAYHWPHFTSGLGDGWFSQIDF